MIDASGVQAKQLRAGSSATVEATFDLFPHVKTPQVGTVIDTDAGRFKVTKIVWQHAFNRGARVLADLID